MALCLMTHLCTCQPVCDTAVFLYECHLSALSSFCPVTAGGQLRPEVSAPLCQRGISPDVQEADQAGEGQRRHEGGAGQVQVAVWRCQRLAHRGGGEDAEDGKTLYLLSSRFIQEREVCQILLCDSEY